MKTLQQATDIEAALCESFVSGDPDLRSLCRDLEVGELLGELVVPAKTSQIACLSLPVWPKHEGPV